MLTPSDVLNADAKQVNEWCAVLDGYAWAKGGEGVLMVKQTNGNSFYMNVPFEMHDYTGSLDAIWPLQQEAMRLHSEDRCDYRYWLKRTMTPNTTNLIHKYIVADAYARARAVCLARLAELTQKLGEE